MEEIDGVVVDIDGVVDTAEDVGGVETMTMEVVVELEGTGGLVNGADEGVVDWPGGM